MRPSFDRILRQKRAGKYPEQLQGVMGKESERKFVLGIAAQ